MIDHAQRINTRLDAIEQADYCAKWLKAQGLEVLAVIKGPVTPIIIIRNSELCKDFEGQVQAYESGQRGAKRYRFVMRYGCEVRWADHVEACPRATPNLARFFLKWGVL